LNSLVVGAVGNIKPVKGYDILLTATESIIRDFPEAHFIIIGAPYGNEMYFKELKSLVLKNGLET